MKKKIVLLISTLIMSLSLPLLSFASTFSEYWYQDSQGNWHIQDQNGNMVTNAWLCDDAVASNGQDIWYLIDSNGNMVSAGLVQDQTGNIYSIETSHNGFYGMLRYQSGTYDGVYLDLENSHGGSFSKIKNQDGINGLQGIYGLTQVNIDNSNCVYTSSFKGSDKLSGGSVEGTPNADTNNGYYDWSDPNTFDNLFGHLYDDARDEPWDTTGREWNWH